MGYVANDHAEHMRMLQLAYNHTERVAARTRIISWAGGIFTFSYLVFIGLYINDQYWILYAMTGFVMWKECVLLAMPAMVGGLVCYISEMHRSMLHQQLLLARLSIDVKQGVYDAIREFLGSELPQYAQFLETFNLAEELWQIGNGMSENYQRAFMTTTKALEALEQAGGLAGIKAELLKSAALAKFIKDLMDLFGQHPDVLQAAQFDEAVNTVVTDFQARLEEVRKS